VTEKDKSPTTVAAEGFTLLELILTVILVGIAGSIVVVGLSSLSGVGKERKAVVDAQLAQERMELILAEKRRNGFPNSDDGVDGPDPCTRHNLAVDDYPACDPNKITYRFKNQDGDDHCYKNNAINCTVTVEVQNGPTFKMLLYNFK
jgi:prepilin-type N-terminal cleavage/methylation domain-containing protein